jgi:ABC-type Fe3+ transport system permease subunit
MQNLLVKETEPMTTALAILIIVVSAIGLGLTLGLTRKQKKSLDESVSPTVARHTILANPVIIAYAVFHVVIIIAAVLAVLYS